MRNKLLCALALIVAFVTVGRGSDWKKDPDVTIDPANVVASNLALLAPQPTATEAADTVLGPGADVVGIDDAALAATPAASSSGAIFVDDDHLDCPNATFTTIQAAVNASGPNDTIKVCPGTYREQVRIVGHIHDGLRLESLQPWKAVIQWPTVESFPLALVDFNGADHVRLRDFTITGPFTFPGCSPDRHEGILVENAFDERILHNHITLIRNSLPALFGCQEGDAVAIGRRSLGTAPGSAEVAQNQIDEYQKNGIQAVNSGTFLHADHNVVTGSSNPAIRAIIASNGVVVFRQAAAVVDHNAISGNQFVGTPPGPVGPLSTGVILDEAPAGSSSVDHNQVFQNDFGIETDTQVGLDISHNDVFNNVADAITLCGDVAEGCGPAQNIKVRNNRVVGNEGSGVLLLGAVSNLLKTNDVDSNGTDLADTTDGLRIDAQSTQNQINENHMSSNVTHDCHDDSAGAGTAGTANFWINDQGATQNRPGLCR